MANMRVPKGSIVSKYGSSSCRYCFDTIKVGEVIRNGDKGWGHHRCVVRAERAERAILALDRNADAANSRRWNTT